MAFPDPVFLLALKPNPRSKMRMTKARLQQDRSRATRRAIIEAAETLWRDHGFDAVSVEDICRRADVAKGTFYFYFPRKEYLLVMIVFGRWMPRPVEVQALVETKLTTRAILAELMTQIGEHARRLEKRLTSRAVEESIQHYREIGRLEGGDRSLYQVYRPVFARGVERGEVDESWDVDLLARMLGWATLQEVFMWGDGQTTDRNIIPNLRQRADLIVTGAAQARPVAAQVTRIRPKRRDAD
jgi:AcrR family transcriptional regulator